MTLAASEIAVRERLRGISLALEPGRVTAICGPNGAGKSSLLEGLAGLLRPDLGRVTLDGGEFARLSARARARALGYLPQNAEVAWDVPVRSLVALGRMPHGDAAEAPVAAAMQALDIAQLADRRALSLSGGERARVLLARVLAGEPRWILADEPLAALDLAHQLALLAHLRRVAADGIGVVLVLHDLAHAMNHADRVIVLNAGTIAADGPPAEALGEQVVEAVWGVRACWIGEPGARALIAAAP